MTSLAIALTIFLGYKSTTDCYAACTTVFYFRQHNWLGLRLITLCHRTVTGSSLVVINVTCLLAFATKIIISKFVSVVNIILLYKQLKNFVEIRIRLDGN